MSDDGPLPQDLMVKLEATPTGRLMMRWLIQRSTRKLSPHTVKRYVNDHQRVLVALASVTGKPATEVEATDLTEPNLRDAFALYSGRRSKSTVAGAVTTWTLFLNALVRDKVIGSNPISDNRVERPKVEKGTPKALHSPEHSLGLLFMSAARGDRPTRNGEPPWTKRDVAALALIATTGIRSAEACGAFVRDLEVGKLGWQLHVRGKGSKERWVPVDDYAAELVHAFLAERAERFPKSVRAGKIPGSAPLLCDDDGKPLRTTRLYTIVRACFRAAGVSTPGGAMVHALRHTKATLMANSGASATDIQALLGHESLATSQLYVTASAEQVRKAAMDSPDVGILRDALQPKETA